MLTAKVDLKETKRSELMLKAERALFWLCHLSMAAAVITVVFRDYFEGEYLSTQVFATGVLLYTFTLGLSVFLDKVDSSRRANNDEARSLGTVLKPVLLACLIVVLFLSGLVVLIDILVERAGIYF